MTTSPDRRVPDPPVAIVGIGALFPGSTTAQGFWGDIVAGRDRITEVPATHWRTEDYFDARRDEKAASDARAAQVRAERSKECSELRRNLSQIERDGRYFTTDANGERTYIDVKEVEAARSRLSSRIAQRCG